MINLTIKICPILAVSKYQVKYVSRSLSVDSLVEPFYLVLPWNPWWVSHYLPWINQKVIPY